MDGFLVKYSDEDKPAITVSDREMPLPCERQGLPCQIDTFPMGNSKCAMAVLGNRDPVEACTTKQISDPMIHQSICKGDLVRTLILPDMKSVARTCQNKGTETIKMNAGNNIISPSCGYSIEGLICVNPPFLPTSQNNTQTENYEDIFFKHFENFNISPFWLCIILIGTILLTLMCLITTTCGLVWFLKKRIPVPISNKSSLSTVPPSQDPPQIRPHPGTTYQLVPTTSNRNPPHALTLPPIRIVPRRETVLRSDEREGETSFIFEIE